MARSTWYKLDNVGKFYSAQAGNVNQTVFRFSAAMRDEVDACALDSALKAALEMYPGFNVVLRSGFFWHYLEPAQNIPEVTPETLPPCFGIHANAQSHLFRVTYFRNKINLEMSHMISDGRGTSEFFRTLIYAYIQFRYGVEGLLRQSNEAGTRLTEDSFSENYEREKAKGTKAPKVFKLKGWKDQADPTYMVYHLPSDEVYARSKSMGVSVTSLLVAAVLKAIVGTMPPKDKKKTVLLNIPVDLRQHYDSATIRNFFGLATVRYRPEDAELSVGDIARTVQCQITNATELDVLKMRMNQMVKLEKNPFLRMAPLFLKDAVLELAARIADRKVTSTLSSLGRISLEPDAEPYVQGIEILTSTRGLNFVACTYGQDLSIGISTIFANHGLIRDFNNVFRDMGIEGRLDIDKEARDVDRQLRQSALEDSINKLTAPKQKGKKHEAM